MASISKQSGGRKMIQFTDADGKRRSIRLGKMPVKRAESIKFKVETLHSVNVSGDSLDNDTAKWVRDLPTELANKLAKVDLIPKRDATTVGGLIKAFLATRTHIKPATLIMWRQAGNDLTEHFGENQSIRGISRVDAEEFRQGLVNRKLAASTISKRLQRIRQMFAHAVRFEWLGKNPFEGITHKGGDPRKRQRYITVEDTEKLIEAAPNYIWRTIIALCRFGGLRSPSEVLSLPLDNLDWERGAMTVISPKTEGCGQGSRVVPIFKQLRPYLLDAAEMAKNGQTHVIPEDLYLPAAHGPRGWVNCNLRTTFQKIVERAGLEPWPRLFHNLRASCESDLVREYPITTVCKWLGNTVSVAAKHYIQVTDTDFKRAAQGSVTTKDRALQNALQNTPEIEKTDPYKKSKSPAFPGKNEAVRECTNAQVAAQGFEPRTRGL